MNLSPESKKLLAQTRESLRSPNGIYVKNELLVPKTGLTVKVTKPLVTRALRLMSILLHHVQIRGHKIYTKRDKTVILILGHELGISCREKTNRVAPSERKKAWQTYYPTGQLSINLEGYYQRQWLDGKEALEDQIPKILDKLEDYASKMKITFEKAREGIREQEALRRVELEKEKRIQNDKLRFEKLLGISKKYNEVINMVSFIEAIRMKFIDNLDPNPRISKFLEWADVKVVEYRETFFDDINLVTLD